MTDTWQEHCDYEVNARYDHISEAYAATALDPYEEGYSDYLFDCQDAGQEPLSFADWKAGLKANTQPTPQTWNLESWPQDLEIPF